MTYRVIQHGFRVVEVPIVFRDRQAGTSKMDRSIVAEAAWRVPLLRFGTRPPKGGATATKSRRYTF